MGLTQAATTIIGGSIGNGDFEAPSGNGPISGSGDWVEFGTAEQAIQASAWAAENSDQGVWLKGFHANQNGGFFQENTASSGQTYTLSTSVMFNENAISNGLTLSMSLVWLDSSGTEIGSNILDISGNVTADNATGWNTYSLTDIAAPDGVASVRTTFHWTTDDTIENYSQSSALIDNVTLTMIPEPSSACLIGLGGLAMVMRRRK